MESLYQIRLTMAALALTAIACLMAGCSKRESAAGGAVVGGTSGALVGYGVASAGSKGAGAAVGGVAGLVVGGLIGHALGEASEDDHKKESKKDE
jgi:hypothetical protein